MLASLLPSGCYEYGSQSGRVLEYIVSRETTNGIAGSCSNKETWGAGGQPQEVHAPDDHSRIYVPKSVILILVLGIEPRELYS